MNRVVAIALVAWIGTPVFAQTNVSVSINQPGVYGRIQIGNLPPPIVVYPEPVIIRPRRVAVYQEPVYLYVPPGHQKNWAKHCSRYSACGQPVYFVQETWVRERYEDDRDQHRVKSGKHDNEDKKGKKPKKDKEKHGKD